MTLQVQSHSVHKVGEASNKAENHNIYDLLFTLLADAKRLSNDQLQLSFKRVLDGNHAIEKSSKELEAIPVGALPADLEQGLQSSSSSAEDVARAGAILTGIQIKQSKANAYREGVSNDMVQIRQAGSLDSTAMNTETQQGTQTTETANESSHATLKCAEKLYQ